MIGCRLLQVEWRVRPCSDHSRSEQRNALFEDVPVWSKHEQVAPTVRGRRRVFHQLAVDQQGPLQVV